ncbi:MAG: DUF3754 domain-containing protein [Pyrinomonadaceae bacterium]|nr:DUF3754 domain-containing protein [Phycisphaerales bacterium]
MSAGESGTSSTSHPGNPSPPAAPPWKNRFIPISPADLARSLEGEAARLGVSTEELRTVLLAIEEATSKETRAIKRTMADLYAIFNPDRDTLPLCILPKDQWEASYADLEKRIGYLFDKANFELLSDVQIETAILEAKSHGLRIRVRAERIDKLLLWVRGQGVIYKRRKHWKSPIRGTNSKYDVFHRLGVLAKLKDDPHVHLKLFRDVPAADIEALLPHAEVGMSWFDRVKVIGGGAGALGTLALKIIQGALTLALVSKLVWVVLMALGLMAGRTFFGYRRNKSMRDAQRTQNLYCQTLANNGGVLSWLVDMIGQEEEKEAMLGYVMCMVEPAGIQGEGAAGAPSTSERGEVETAEFKARSEAFLKHAFNVTVDFDAADSIETLDRFDLWERARTLRTVGIKEAIRRIEAYCESGRWRGYHEGRIRGMGDGG